MSSLLVSDVIINDELTLYCPFADNYALLKPETNFLNVKYTLPSSSNTRQYNLVPFNSQITSFPLTSLTSPATYTSLGICYEIKLYNSSSDNYAVLRLKSSQLSIDYTLPAVSNTYGYNIVPVIASQPTASSIPAPASLNSLEVTGRLKLINNALNNYVLFDLASDFLHIRYTLPGGTEEYEYNLVPIVSSSLPAPPVSDTVPTIVMGSLPSSIPENTSVLITYTFASPIQEYQKAYLIFSVAPGVNSISNTFTGLTGGTITLSAGTYNPISNNALSFTINYLCSTNLYTSPSIPIAEGGGTVYPPSEYEPGEYDASTITYPGTTIKVQTSRLVFFNTSNSVYFICKESATDPYTLPKVTNQVLIFTQAERSEMKRIGQAEFGIVKILMYDIDPSTQRLIYLEGGNINICDRIYLSDPLVPASTVIGTGSLTINQTYVNKSLQAVAYITGSNTVVYYYELSTTTTIAINTGASGAYVVNGQVVFVNHLGNLVNFVVVGNYVVWSSGNTVYMADLPGTGYTILTVLDSLVVDPVGDEVLNLIEFNGALRVYHGDGASAITTIWGEKFSLMGGSFARIFRNEIQLPLEIDMVDRLGYTWNMVSPIKNDLLMCVGRAI